MTSSAGGVADVGSVFCWVGREADWVHSVVGGGISQD